MGPDIGTPIILNLYQMVCNVFVPTFMATNSLPNADLSMADCFFEYQLIHIHHESGSKPSSLFVASMTAVYEHIYVHLFTFS